MVASEILWLIVDAICGHLGHTLNDVWFHIDIVYGKLVYFVFISISTVFFFQYNTSTDL